MRRSNGCIATVALPLWIRGINGQLKEKRMSPEEEVRLKDGLDAFFKGAGRGSWNREVNEEVANVFATMLCFVNKCSKAMNWVPRPTYNPGATWLFTNLTRSSINSLRSGQ
jgi:hypothetical protein